ncbi:Protein tyrosine phosphatase type IVA 1 [Blyttiomyces sp. JEL0837]|nr:Protein tyrosine phosphatase type IVA 1 [Blyttiomyces sp. JEL0837]
MQTRNRPPQFHSPYSHRVSIIEHPLTPIRFIITDCPSDANLTSDYKPIFEENGVHHIVRLCEPTVYDGKVLQEFGIEVVDLAFEDGSVPPEPVLTAFRSLIDQLMASSTASTDTSSSSRTTDPPSIAIHCVSGIGRAPVLVVVALVDAGMEPLEAVELVRQKRRGALNKKQLEWVMDGKKGLKKRKPGTGTGGGGGGFWGKGSSSGSSAGSSGKSGGLAAAASSHLSPNRSPAPSSAHSRSSSYPQTANNSFTDLSNASTISSPTTKTSTSAALSTNVDSKSDISTGNHRTDNQSQTLSVETMTLDRYSRRPTTNGTGSAPSSPAVARSSVPMSPSSSSVVSDNFAAMVLKVKRVMSLERVGGPQKGEYRQSIRSSEAYNALDNVAFENHASLKVETMGKGGRKPSFQLEDDELEAD